MYCSILGALLESAQHCVTAFFVSFAIRPQYLLLLAFVVLTITVRSNCALWVRGARLSFITSLAMVGKAPAWLALVIVDAALPRQLILVSYVRVSHASVKVMVAVRFLISLNILCGWLQPPPEIRFTITLESWTIFKFDLKWAIDLVFMAKD